MEGFRGHSNGSMSLDRYGDKFSTVVLLKECFRRSPMMESKQDDLKIGWKKRIK